MILRYCHVILGEGVFTVNKMNVFWITILPSVSPRISTFPTIEIKKTYYIFI